MRYKVILEYFGKNYSGWQRQINALSIQEIVENALSKVLQENISIVGSGRTDKGVHAMGQVAHFDTSSTIAPYNILRATNSLLPHDIKIMECTKVSDDFHAQFDAVRKEYVYKVYMSSIIKPLKDDYYARIIKNPDMALIKEGAKKLIGKHDFAAFSATKGSALTTVREIYSIDIIEQGEDIIFHVIGNGFLYNMVRIIVGTLIYVGENRIPLSNIDDMLASGKRDLGGKTFSAKGLYLKEVVYN